MTSPEHLSADDICWEAVSPDADDHALDLTDLVITALEEAQSYRLLAQKAIHLVHVQDVQLKQLRSHNQRSRRIKVERALLR